MINNEKITNFKSRNGIDISFFLPYFFENHRILVLDYRFILFLSRREKNIHLRCRTRAIIIRDNVVTWIDIVIYVSRKRIPFFDTDVKGYRGTVSMGHPRNKFCESRRKVGRDIYREKEFFFFSRNRRFWTGGRWTRERLNHGLRFRIDDDTVGQSRYAKSVGSTPGSRYGNDRVARSRRNHLEWSFVKGLFFVPSPSLSLLHR